MNFRNPLSELSCLTSTNQTPNKYSSFKGGQKQSLNQQISLSYSNTNKNTNKYISYDSETQIVKQGNFFNRPMQKTRQTKCQSKIGQDLQLLNNKLEQLQQCFLNMSTIQVQNKQNVRPGMFKKLNKNSRQSSKSNFVTKRNSFDHRNQNPSTIRTRNSFLQQSMIKQMSKQKQKQITKLKKQMSFCQKSLSNSQHKKQILEKKVQDYSQKIKNYKILERKSKKLQSDYNKLLKTLQKSQQVRIKQKSLIHKYEIQIKNLNKLIKHQK